MFLKVNAKKYIKSALNIGFYTAPHIVDKRSGGGYFHYVEKKRLVGLDVFRLFSVLMVFLFHSRIHRGIDYRVFNTYIEAGAAFMTAFFIISGFSIFYIYKNKDLSDINNIKRFYLNRLLSILPLYLFMTIIYFFVQGSDKLIDNLVVLPIEIAVIQSTFSSLFSVFHNGGTWFISCILICYFIYPFIQTLINQTSKRTRIVIVILISLISCYSPYIVKYFGIQDIYSNPFFRALEFIIGSIACSFLVDGNEVKSKHNNLFYIAVSIVILIIHIIIVTLLDFDYNWTALNVVNIPCFVLIIYFSSMINIDCLQNSRLLRYLVSISYAFFLSQFFTWDLLDIVTNKFNITSGKSKLIVAFIICLTLSILMHELIEKPLRRLFLYISNRNNNI